VSDYRIIYTVADDVLVVAVVTLGTDARFTTDDGTVQLAVAIRSVNYLCAPSR